MTQPIGTEERKTRENLANLVIASRQFQAIMDALMKLPSTEERGKKIAYALNGLTMATDSALWYGLGLDYRKDRKDDKGNFSMIHKLSRKRDDPAHRGICAAVRWRETNDVD